MVNSITKRIAVQLGILAAVSVVVLPNAAADALSKAHLNTLNTAFCSPQMQGRGTNTPGGRCAQQYIASQFTDNKLVTLGTNRMDDQHAAKDGSGYFQPFKLIESYKVTSKQHLSWACSGKKTTLKWKKQFRADPSGASGKLKAEAVYVNQGYIARDGSRNDYLNLDVEDKVAVVTSDIPEGTNIADNSVVQYKAAQALLHSAAAMIIIEPNTVELSKIADASEMSLPIPVIHISQDAAQPLLQAMKSGLHPMVDINVQTKPCYGAASNIIGLLPGTTPELQDRPYIVCCHADHLGIVRGELRPGADDDGSGTAVMLSIMSALKDHPLRHPVLFIAFMGEEKGLMGSAYYVEHPLWPIDQTEALLDFDMVGRLRDDKLWAMCVGSSPKWDNLLDNMNQAVLIPFNLTKEKTYSGMSDFGSFLPKGVPSLCLFTGLHAEYHKSTDTLSTLNVWGQKRVALFGLQILRELDKSDDKLASSDLNKE